MKKFIVCTWWTHVWKTSVLKYLEKQGYTIKESFAHENMDLLSGLLWKEGYRNWRKDNFLDFQKMNIIRDLKLYVDAWNIKNTKEDIIFFDRWIFDYIASLHRENNKIPQNIEKLFEQILYFSKVFIFEPIPFHDKRECTWRMLDKNNSLKWAWFIEEEYIKRWYRIIKVPYIETWDISKNIEKRAEFLLKNI